MVPWACSSVALEGARVSLYVSVMVSGCVGVPMGKCTGGCMGDMCATLRVSKSMLELMVFAVVQGEKRKKVFMC